MQKQSNVVISDLTLRFFILLVLSGAQVLRPLPDIIIICSLLPPALTSSWTHQRSQLHQRTVLQAGRKLAQAQRSQNAAELEISLIVKTFVTIKNHYNH